jgi:hypothetical protein
MTILMLYSLSFYLNFYLKVELEVPQVTPMQRIFLYNKNLTNLFILNFKKKEWIQCLIILKKKN